FSSFIGAMSFAVSTMSEMYVAFGYIVLACSVHQTVQLFRDAGGSGAILKNPLCMDKLRTMTALVVPKEGIFTTRENVADRIFAEDRLYDITDRRGRRAMERPILYAILSTGMYGEKYLQSLSDHTVRLTRTEEETSILNLARRMDIYNVRLDRAYPLLDHRGVGGESEFETSLVRHKEELIAVSRGECELLLSRCSYYYKNGRIMLLTPEIRTGILIAYRKLVRQAYSVVAMASHTYQYNNLKFVGAAQRDMVFEGFVAFRVPYLRGIGQLVEDAREAGIKVILTTERPAASEVYFAKQIGILDKKEQAVDGSTLRKMKEGIRRTNASYFRLYCGLDTAQKQELLTYLHEQGEVVGVVGRRLEDLCLLRAADVSFAQNIAVRQDKSAIGRQDTVISKVSDSTGEDGCEALKFESDVIVSDAQVRGGGGFRAILDTIGIAKNTDMNVIRIIKYLLCAQTARFLLVFYTILFSKDGMGAVQALFAGLFADFLSVMVIAFQKPSPDVLRTAGDAEPWLAHPLRMGIPQIITGACWACTAILASFFAGLFGFAGTELAQGSVLYVTSMLISVLMLFSQQREDFLWRPGVRMSALHTIYLLALVELFLLFFLFPTFGTMFGVASFAPLALVIIGVLAVVELVLAECIKMLARMRERPDLQSEDEETAERHMQITALFHLFRAQKAQEDAALHAQVRDEGNTDAGAADDGSAAGDAVKETEAAAAASGGKPEKKPFFAWMHKRKTEGTAPSDQAAASLAEMEEYVNAMRQKDAEKRAESAASGGKKPRFSFGRKSGSVHGIPQSSGFFAEEDADFTPAVPVTLSEDDALLAALRADESPAEAVPPVFAAAEQDENAQTAEFSPETDAEGADMLPDPRAYEEAMAHIADGPATRDITIGGTDAEVRTFLRTALREDDGKTAEDADREFLGIGYLFSEEEYEAIMAEYNADGTQNAVYNTETQKFDIVGEKPE
ncbi:MAG: cation-transporting P-type ATPase, partial [Clostridia bacterium]|nr:cation-transporting P-type ATPase [Clostridia bacterium]